jgi:hypothetical protein
MVSATVPTTGPVSAANKAGVNARTAQTTSSVLINFMRVSFINVLVERPTGATTGMQVKGKSGVFQ